MAIHAQTARAGEYGVKRKDKDGWTAFTLLASCWIFKEGNSSYILAERLLHLGASVDERAPTNGATPLITQAWTVKLENASGLQLLLRYGADVNAQRKDGYTCIHHLVGYQKLSVLRQLYTESQNHMMAVDYTIKNNKQETALQMAERVYAESVDGEGKRRAKEIMFLLHLQHTLWQEEFSSFILCSLDPHLIPDVASMIVSYIHPTSSPSS